MKKIIPLLCTVMMFFGMSFTANTIGEGLFSDTDSTTTQETEQDNPTDLGQAEEIVTTESADLVNEEETQEDNENDSWRNKSSERKKKDKDEEEPLTMDVVLKIFLFLLGGAVGASIMYAVSTVKINNIESSMKSGDKNSLKDAEKNIKSIRSMLNDCNDILEKNIVPYADSTNDKFIDVSQKIGNIRYITDDTDDVDDLQ